VRARLDKALAIRASICLSPLIAHPSREFFDNFIKSVFDGLSIRRSNLACHAKGIEILGGNRAGNCEFIRAKSFF
jgi:hypothetical protein